ncbi:MAG: NAD(P)H-hydrate dehydratase [Verrucomicrobia bacterium]|nr:NAD(P)H-hydrate dehydratase [Verrucomicrobiota bacterium]
MPAPVISVAQMREWEKVTWAAGISEEAVMRRAGAAVAERARALTRPGESILVFAGKGHNGDDARFAAEGLADRVVRVLNVTDPRAALAEVRRANAALFIDGLFGIGLNRPLDAAWCELIRTVNARGVPVLAVDVPSGLDADTGATHGEPIHASVTVTFGCVKRGLLRAEAVPFVGRLELANDIGLIACPFKEAELNWTLPEDFKNFPPPRPVASHKGTFGHAVIFAGSVGYHGAAVLAARGALQAMPGLVTVFTCEDSYVPVASQLQQAMVHPWKPGLKLPPSCSAVLFGPGLAGDGLPAELKAETARLWREADVPVIADASGLGWLPSGAVPNGALRCITPHPGEAARMLWQTSAHVQGDRAASVRELSQRWGDCCVVLKGHQTVVGRSTGPLFINPSGNPMLAQGGSGDVLAGFLAGVLAQPAARADALRAVLYAVWRHGRAADQMSALLPAWTTEQFIPALGGNVD